MSLDVLYMRHRESPQDYPQFTDISPLAHRGYARVFAVGTPTIWTYLSS